MLQSNSNHWLKKKFNISLKKHIILTLASVVLWSSVFSQTAPPAYAPTGNLYGYWRMDGSYQNYPTNYAFQNNSSTAPTFTADRDGNTANVLQVEANVGENRSGIIEVPNGLGNSHFNLSGNELTMHVLVNIPSTITSLSQRSHIIGKRANAGTAPFNAYTLMVESHSLPDSPRMSFALSTLTTSDALIYFPMTSSDFNRWMFVTAVYDGTQMKLYKDGILVNEALISGNINSGNLAARFGIGGLNVNGLMYRGGIDEAYLYDRALSDAEVLALARTNDFLLETPALAFTQQSSNLSVCLTEPQTRTISVAVNRFAGQATFQWKKNGVDLVDNSTYSGSTTSSLTISNISSIELASYTCYVVSGAENIESNPIVISEGAGFENLNGLIRSNALNNESTTASPIGSGLINSNQTSAGTLLTATNRFGNPGKAKSTSAARDHFAFNPAFNQTELTISFWYKHTGTTRLPTSPINVRGGLLSFNQEFPYNSSRGYLVVDNDELKAVTSAGDVATGIMMNDGNWKHITYVNNDGNYKLYVNGSLASSGNTGTYKPSTHPINALGYFRNVSDMYNSLEFAANGSYDDIRVYNRELVDFEVSSLSAFDNPELVAITAPETVSICEQNLTVLQVVLENEQTIPVSYLLNGTEVATGASYSYEGNAAGSSTITYSVEPIGCNAYDLSFLETEVSVTSNSFAVTLPEHVIRCSNDFTNLVLSVGISGNTAGLTYQWFRNSSALTDFNSTPDGNGNIVANGTAGSTTNTLRLGFSQANQNANYTLRISGGDCNPFTTNPIQVSMSTLPLPGNFQIDQSASACLGTTIELSVASIENATDYGWGVVSNPTFEFNNQQTNDVNIPLNSNGANGFSTSITAKNADGCLTEYAHTIMYANTPGIGNVSIYGDAELNYDFYTIANGNSSVVNGFTNYRLESTAPVSSTFWLNPNSTNVGNGTLQMTWEVNGQTFTTYNVPSIDIVETTDITVTGLIPSTGCTRTATVTAIVNPIGTISASNTTVCEGSAVVLTVQGGSVVSGTWLANGNSIPGAGTSTSISVTPTTTTEYSVILSSAGRQFRHRITVEVAPFENIEITTQPQALIQQCGGGDVTLSVAVSGATSYQWKKEGVDLVGETNATLNLTSVSSSDAGEYTVFVSNACGASTLSEISVLQVTGVTAILSGLPASLDICSTDNIVLNVLAAGANLSYTWKIDGMPIAGENTSSFTLQNATSGIYTVEVEGSCGTIQTSSTTVNSTSSPIVTVSASQTEICAGTEITLTASGADNYDWSNNVQNAQSFFPAETTTYTVVGSVNGCNSNPMDVTIVVNPIPVVTLASTTLDVCAGDEVTLLASGAQTYSWTNGVQNGVAFVPTTTNTYEVVGTSNGCASDAVLVTVNVNAIPSVSINSSVSGAICSGESVVLTATGAQDYVWTNGVENAVAFTPNSTQSYSVVGISNGCSSSSVSIDIEVTQSPSISIASTNVEVCEGESVTLNASGADVYFWTNMIENNVAFVPTISTTYTVTGFTGICSSQPIDVFVLVTPNPVLTIVSSSNEVCEGEPVVLTAAGATSISWSHGVENGISFVPTETMTYSVSGSTNSCPASAQTVEVVVNPIPVVTVLASALSVCENEEVMLTASGADSYSWTNNIQNGIAFIPTETATYTVTGFSSVCSSESVEIEISVTPTPILDLQTSSLVICEGEEISLTATGADVISWNNDVENGIAFTPSASSSYQVIGSTNGCESSPVNVDVTVNEIPVITINPTAIAPVCEGTEVVLTASGANTYTWTNGVQNGVGFVPTETEIYTVSGTTNNCSSDEISIEVVVNALPQATVVFDEQTSTLSTGTFDSYQWYLNGTAISGATNQTLVISENGSYSVVVSSNSCENESNTVVVNSLSLDNFISNAFSMQVYPNPSTGIFTIEVSSQTTISIVDALGKVISEYELNTGKNTIDLSNVQVGMYFIHTQNTIFKTN
jgi:hypothetical protein